MFDGGQYLGREPEVEFLGPRNMCPYMQKITLEKVLWSLHSMTGAVEVGPRPPPAPASRSSA